MKKQTALEIANNWSKLIPAQRLLLEEKVGNRRKVLYQRSDGSFILEKHSAGKRDIYLVYARDRERSARKDFKQTTL